MRGEGQRASSSLLLGLLDPGAGDPVRVKGLGLVHQQRWVVSLLQGIYSVSVCHKWGLVCVLQGCSLTTERERKRLVSLFTNYSCRRGM